MSSPTLFLREKRFEGACGLALTKQTRVTAQNNVFMHRSNSIKQKQPDNEPKKQKLNDMTGLAYAASVDEVKA